MTIQIRLSVFSAILLLIAIPANSQSTYTDEVKPVAVSLFNSFDKMQTISGRLNFNDTSRVTWNYVPTGLRPRAGTSIGNMTDDQRKLLHRILSASLSSQGYLKATGIMHLDDLLNRYVDSVFYKKEISDSTYNLSKTMLWSHKSFYFAFFGNPSDSIWGYKLEGHHLSINFTFINDKISATPYFMGTRPAEYPFSEYAGWRVLGQEEDLGIRFIHLLTPVQQKKATMSTAVPKDIITSAGSGKRLVDNWGISGAEMNTDQQVVLQYIIREFVFNLEYDKAVIEYEKIVKTGIDKIYFGWIGEYDEKVPHYYILNGPTFIIEFDNINGSHIHGIWREKGNEFGEDVLKKHYQLEKHQ